MKFSVLLSVYSKENPLFLKEALNSVFIQTVVPDEVILVKDGKLTTDLDRVIEDFETKYSTFKVVALDENIGLGGALNEGLKHCSYEWVARMDTDDICFPDRFEKQLNYIKLHPEVSFVSGSIAEFMDTPDNIYSYRKLPEKHEDIYKYAKKRCPINHPAVMYKKEAVLNLGGYYEFPEDYHLWIRALSNGYKFYNIQEPLLYFRINLDMIRRRGGLDYAKIEMKHQWEFYKIGFISYPQYIYNCIIRFTVRLIPIRLRSVVYFKLLRK